ncbi:DUF2868 domain-containing protein [Comamonas sp. NLF-1-9]|uniref:DUF2868 domain-containing protein n=1 Tax=Comamonas sp. NLF-1-9 TaxID=2853163 RepID=UPI001C461558|nr:DUF2868 domain-containing protein [Comamonas sp. NLF-1-9]QXL84169.1 DUF2868 domain-containing protein [Comamonas sp. NLF-1-9]
MDSRPPHPAGDVPSRSALQTAVIVRAIERIERAGALDDGAELRQAWAGGGTHAEQVAQRAWLLGERLGLPQELARWRAWGRPVVLLLAVLLALAGLAAARSVLTPERSINAVAAFVTLLGLHLVTLLLWLLGLAWSARGAAPSGPGLSLGHWAVAASARLASRRAGHAQQLWQALAGVLGRERLWPWLGGMLGHGIWTLSLALTWLVLVFAFAFQSYQLTWETTILSPGFFEAFVRSTGALPALLGWPVPGSEAVLAAGRGTPASAAGQHAWAMWLLACVLFYGILPRLVLALWSWRRWRRATARLQPVDMADPGVQALVRRLQALEPPPQVLDPERGAAAPEPLHEASGAAPGTGAPLVVGFELRPEQPWPLPELARLGNERLDGSSEQRERFFARLRAERPGALLWVVHASASPDRGSGRLLREAGQQAGRMALWPLGEAGRERWQAWLQSEGFSAVTLVDQAQRAIDWIAQGECA